MQLIYLRITSTYFIFVANYIYARWDLSFSISLSQTWGTADIYIETGLRGNLLKYCIHSCSIYPQGFLTGTHTHYVNIILSIKVSPCEIILPSLKISDLKLISFIMITPLTFWYALSIQITHWNLIDFLSTSPHILEVYHYPLHTFFGLFRSMYISYFEIYFCYNIIIV